MIKQQRINGMHRPPSSAAVAIALVTAGILLLPLIGVAAELAIEDRVACQRAIEEVYWRHSEWPSANPGPKPGLDEVLSAATIRRRAEDAARLSHLMEEYYSRPITAKDLQAELDRMVSETMAPEVLEELFAALGNDATTVAECLARPIMARRLALQHFADDERIHGALRQQVEKQLAGVSMAADLRKLDGEYFELVARPSYDGKDTSLARGGALLDPSSWAEHLTRLDRIMADSKAGAVSTLQEDREKLRIIAVLERDDEHTKVASVTWPKRDFGEWWRQVREHYPAHIEMPDADYSLRRPKQNSKAEGWSSIPVLGGMTPTARYMHTAVWTGSHMIIWGGTDGVGVLHDGAWYNPATVVWWPISSTLHPDARAYHTAVWTGTNMIVWGGWAGSSNIYNTGGLYNFAEDQWSAMFTTNAPAARYRHAAVWTGSSMIVWGGTDGTNYLNTGGSFGEAGLVWSTLPTAGAPSGRVGHTMVYYPVSGDADYVVIWGGGIDAGVFGNGARFKLGIGTWHSVSTTNAPSAREGHSAVWLSGPANNAGRMVVWGGYNRSSHLFTGGRYDAVADSWQSTSTNGTPVSRQGHTAVMIGERMVVWGGYAGTEELQSGGVYNHLHNVWRGTLSTSLTPRKHHTAVVRTVSSTENRMMVWGGYDNSSDETNTGAQYRPMGDFGIYCYGAPLDALTGGTIDPPTGNCLISKYEDFSELVTLSCDDGIVDGCSFSANPVQPGANPSFTGITVAPYTATGIHTFTVEATAAGFTRTFEMTVNVMSYQLSCSPSSLEVIADGGSAQTTCTVTSLNGYSGLIDLEVPTQDYFLVGFSPSTLSLPASGSASTTLTITTKPTTPLGPTSVNVAAYSSGAFRLITEAITVVEAPEEDIFDDGFESGSTSAWDTTVD